MDSKKEKEVYVPEEIIPNILKRLPVKSLIRFQCVCQAWNNLIKSPSFITKDHLHHSSQNPFLIIESISLLHLLDRNMRFHELQKQPIFESFCSFNVVGSCNGLLLLEHKMLLQLPPPLFLWNPATNEVGPVSSSKLVYCIRRYCCKTGFGFSSILNDYVIVRIYRKRYGRVVCGEVFSLSRGSWKDLDVEVLKWVKIYPFYGSVNVDGGILWIGLNSSSYEDVIVSFDIVNEVFTLIATPDSRGDSYVLNVINENKVASICMIWEADRLAELWVLDEGSCESGRTWRWNKIYNIGNCPDTFDICTVWRNNIVGIDGEHVLYLWDLLTNVVKRSSITCPGRITECSYVESLVSVGNLLDMHN